MDKNTTLNLRVNPDVKHSAEAVLSQLGISMSTAIDIYLRQISMVGGIPFPVTIRQSPDSVNAERMTAGQIRDKIQNGLEDVESGRFRDLDELMRSR